MAMFEITIEKDFTNGNPLNADSYFAQTIVEAPGHFAAGHVPHTVLQHAELLRSIQGPAATASIGQHWPLVLHDDGSKTSAHTALLYPTH